MNSDDLPPIPDQLETPPVKYENLTLPPELPHQHGNEHRQTWGFWATLGLSVAIGLAWVITQAVLGFGYGMVLLTQMGFDTKKFAAIAETLEYDGLMIGIASLGSLPVMMGGCWLFARLRRKHGISVREYLALNSMGWKSWIFWPIISVLVMIVLDEVLQLCGAPEINPWMQKLAENATNFWGLAIAVVICAPLGEEFLFRGFLFKGWLATPLGKTGTLLLSSLLFACIHVQYDVWGLIAVFILGLLMGTARLVSKSLWASIWVHFTNNAFAAWGMYELMTKAQSGG